MALFGGSDGHLVPAQFGCPVAQDLGPDIVDISANGSCRSSPRHFSPVTWRDAGRVTSAPPDSPRRGGRSTPSEILKNSTPRPSLLPVSTGRGRLDLWSDLAAEASVG